uniref:Uncharacterized protein n=1 Tax=Melanopsichium pennsylvanicum 4 TaxID=1398559 RepID=A0A077R5G9_9BASI|nr:uncharacterized protein BN887_06159 [Melanopsichium pennsylvanicum 4]
MTCQTDRLGNDKEEITRLDEPSSSGQLFGGVDQIRHFHPLRSAVRVAPSVSGKLHASHGIGDPNLIPRFEII